MPDHDPPADPPAVPLRKAAAPPKSRARCPECKKAVPEELPAAAPCRPFCSDRCKMIDLSKWLGGSYAIAGEAALPDDDEQ